MQSTALVYTLPFGPALGGPPVSGILEEVNGGAEVADEVVVAAEGR